MSTTAGGRVLGRVLFVGGSREAAPAIRRARELGLHVAVSDGSPDAPGFALADERLFASTYDVAETVAAARRSRERSGRLDGVLCAACDVPVTVAAVAEELGLPGISVATARLAVDKLAMKDRLAAAGVPVPWYAPVGSLEELRRRVAEAPGLLVLKPVDSRGARGVQRLLPWVDLAAAYAEAVRHSPTRRVMIERYLEGPQVSTESLVVGGVAHTPGFSDRNYEYLDRFAPFLIENGGDLPSFLPADTQRAVRDVVQAAAAALGVDGWIVKGDIVVPDVAGRPVPHVIELAARLSGGFFCTHEIPLNTGVDFVGAAIRLAVGDRVDPAELVPRFQRPVCQRYVFPAPGRVVAVRGHEVLQRDGIAFGEIRVAPGDRVAVQDHHPARPGVVIAVGETRDQARERAEAAIRDIAIETDPAL
jgi:biotin carboxylase